jgi:hypothetical protein
MTLFPCYFIDFSLNILLLVISVLELLVYKAQQKIFTPYNETNNFSPLKETQEILLSLKALNLNMSLKMYHSPFSKDKKWHLGKNKILLYLVM